MAVITSHACLAEMAGRYRTRVNRVRKVKDAHQTSSAWLSDVVVTLCRRILELEPELVNQLAEGNADKKILAALIQRLLEQESIRVADRSDIIFQQVQDFLFGYGPLQRYIEDEDISDIDGTGPNEFTFTCRGRREKLELSFPSDQAYDTFCRLVIIRNGGLLNENDSHCRVADSKHRLRINVTVPPRSARQATISIRKHRQQTWSLQDLTRLGMLEEWQCHKIEAMAQSQASVLFCGKGGAGKTTLLRAFIHAMPELERVLVAESDSELYPDKPCCLIQKIKKDNEGGRPVRLRDLIADGLTMSLDTYCIGEIVGAEAMELLEAAHSGHRCLATLHAGSTGDALDRLLSLARGAENGTSQRLLEQMIGRGFHYVIFLENFKVKQIGHVKPSVKGGFPHVCETMETTKANARTDFDPHQPALSLESGS